MRKLYRLRVTNKQHPENGILIEPGDTFACEETLIPAAWLAPGTGCVDGPITPRGLSMQITGGVWPYTTQPAMSGPLRITAGWYWQAGARGGTYDLDLGWLDNTGQYGEGTYVPMQLGVVNGQFTHTGIPTIYDTGIRGANSSRFGAGP